MEPADNTYLPYALRFGVIFAIVAFVGNLAVAYTIISMEPSMMMMILPSLGNGLICLATAVAGLLVVRGVIKEYGVRIPVGKGAVIGLVTGVVIGLASGVLSLLWDFVDPQMTKNMLTAMTGMFDSMPEMDEATRQAAIDQIMANDPSKWSVRLMGLGVAIVMYGVINLISGMIGASVFSKKEEAL